MNKKLRRFIVLSSLGLMVLSSCGEKANNKKYFGDFSYNGKFLNEYASKDISAYEAKELINYTNTQVKLRSHSLLDLENEAVISILSNYSSLTATTKYYVDGSFEEQVREDVYQGTDFLSLIENNNYEPFGQMNVKYLFVDDGIIDYMEEKNDEFKNDKSNVICPFSTPYTYHSNEKDNLIIQTHSFAELPASINGGIGSAYREDCEIIFDKEGKISFWQSSLGIYTSTPTGTIRQGYIFTVDFSWNVK